MGRDYSSDDDPERVEDKKKSKKSKKKKKKKKKRKHGSRSEENNPGHVISKKKKKKDKKEKRDKKSRRKRKRDLDLEACMRKKPKLDDDRSVTKMLDRFDPERNFSSANSAQRDDPSFSRPKVKKKTRKYSKSKSLSRSRSRKTIRSNHPSLNSGNRGSSASKVKKKRWKFSISKSPSLSRSNRKTRGSPARQRTPKNYRSPEFRSPANSAARDFSAARVRDHSSGRSSTKKKKKKVRGDYSRSLSPSVRKRRANSERGRNRIRRQKRRRKRVSSGSEREHYRKREIRGSRREASPRRSRERRIKREPSKERRHKGGLSKEPRVKRGLSRAKSKEEISKERRSKSQISRPDERKKKENSRENRKKDATDKSKSEVKSKAEGTTRKKNRASSREAARSTSPAPPPPSGLPSPSSVFGKARKRSQKFPRSKSKDADSKSSSGERKSPEVGKGSSKEKGKSTSDIITDEDLERQDGDKKKPAVTLLNKKRDPLKASDLLTRLNKWRKTRKSHEIKIKPSTLRNYKKHEDHAKKEMVSDCLMDMDSSSSGEESPTKAPIKKEPTVPKPPPIPAKPPPQDETHHHLSIPQQPVIVYQQHLSQNQPLLPQFHRQPFMPHFRPFNVVNSFRPPLPPQQAIYYPHPQPQHPLQRGIQLPLPPPPQQPPPPKWMPHLQPPPPSGPAKPHLIPQVQQPQPPYMPGQPLSNQQNIKLEPGLQAPPHPPPFHPHPPNQVNEPLPLPPGLGQPPGAHYSSYPGYLDPSKNAHSTQVQPQLNMLGSQPPIPAPPVPIPGLTPPKPPMTMKPEVESVKLSIPPVANSVSQHQGVTEQPSSELVVPQSGISEDLKSPLPQKPLRPPINPSDHLPQPPNASEKLIEEPVQTKVISPKHTPSDLNQAHPVTAELLNPLQSSGDPKVISSADPEVIADPVYVKQSPEEELPTTPTPRTLTPTLVPQEISTEETTEVVAKESLNVPDVDSPNLNQDATSLNSINRDDNINKSQSSVEIVVPEMVKVSEDQPAADERQIGSPDKDQEIEESAIKRNDEDSSILPTESNDAPKLPVKNNESKISKTTKAPAVDIRSTEEPMAVDFQMVLKPISSLAVSHHDDEQPKFILNSQPISQGKQVLSTESEQPVKTDVEMDTKLVPSIEHGSSATNEEAGKQENLVQSIAQIAKSQLEGRPPVTPDELVPEPMSKINHSVSIPLVPDKKFPIQYKGSWFRQNQAPKKAFVSKPILQSEPTVKWAPNLNQQPSTLEPRIQNQIPRHVNRMGLKSKKIPISIQTSNNFAQAYEPFGTVSHFTRKTLLEGQDKKWAKVAEERQLESYESWSDESKYKNFFPQTNYGKGKFFAFKASINNEKKSSLFLPKKQDEIVEEEFGVKEEVMDNWGGDRNHRIVLPARFKSEEKFLKETSEVVKSKKRRKSLFLPHNDVEEDDFKIEFLEEEKPSGEDKTWQEESEEMNIILPARFKNTEIMGDKPRPFTKKRSSIFLGHAPPKEQELKSEVENEWKSLPENKVSKSDDKAMENGARWLRSQRAISSNSGTPNDRSSIPLAESGNIWGRTTDILEKQKGQVDFQRDLIDLVNQKLKNDLRRPSSSSRPNNFVSLFLTKPTMLSQAAIPERPADEDSTPQFPKLRDSWNTTDDTKQLQDNHVLFKNQLIPSKKQEEKEGEEKTELKQDVQHAQSHPQKPESYSEEDISPLERLARTVQAGILDVCLTQKEPQGEGYHTGSYGNNGFSQAEAQNNFVEQENLPSAYGAAIDYVKVPLTKLNLSQDVLTQREGKEELAADKLKLAAEKEKERLRIEKEVTEEQRLRLEKEAREREQTRLIKEQLQRERKLEELERERKKAELERQRRLIEHQRQRKKDEEQRKRDAEKRARLEREERERLEREARAREILSQRRQAEQKRIAAVRRQQELLAQQHQAEQERIAAAQRRRQEILAQEQKRIAAQRQQEEQRRLERERKERELIAQRNREKRERLEREARERKIAAQKKLVEQQRLEREAREAELTAQKQKYELQRLALEKRKREKKQRQKEARERKLEAQRLREEKLSLEREARERQLQKPVLGALDVVLCKTDEYIQSLEKLNLKDELVRKQNDHNSSESEVRPPPSTNVTSDEYSESAFTNVTIRAPPRPGSNPPPPVPSQLEQKTSPTVPKHRLPPQQRNTKRSKPHRFSARRPAPTQQPSRPPPIILEDMQLAPESLVPYVYNLTVGDGNHTNVISSVWGHKDLEDPRAVKTKLRRFKTDKYRWFTEKEKRERSQRHNSDSDSRRRNKAEHRKAVQRSNQQVEEHITELIEGFLSNYPNLDEDIRSTIRSKATAKVVKAFNEKQVNPGYGIDDFISDSTRKRIEDLVGKYVRKFTVR